MSGHEVLLTIKQGKTIRRIEGTRVVFTAGKCFAFDNGTDDINCLNALGNYLKKQPGLAFYGDSTLLNYLLQHTSAPTI